MNIQCDFCEKMFLGNDIYIIQLLYIAHLEEFHKITMKSKFYTILIESYSKLEEKKEDPFDKFLSLFP